MKNMEMVNKLLVSWPIDNQCMILQIGFSIGLIVNLNNCNRPLRLVNPA